MTLKEYLGDWVEVLDIDLLTKTLYNLTRMCPDKYICPKFHDIFKAFRYCPLSDLKVIMIGQDPYPQKDVATGILFGNKEDVPEDKLSPSLKIIKNTIDNYDSKNKMPIFDQTMISWAKQGVLMINSALTCEMNNIGSHTMLWRPFIASLLENLDNKPKKFTSRVYVLFGETAQSLDNHISGANSIIKLEHPAYLARNKQNFYYSYVWPSIDYSIKASNMNAIYW